MFANMDQIVEDVNVIVPPRVDVTTFKVDVSLYTILKAEGFFRNSTDDPNQHLKKFLGVCTLHKQNYASDNAFEVESLQIHSS